MPRRLFCAYSWAAVGNAVNFDRSKSNMVNFNHRYQCMNQMPTKFCPNAIISTCADPLLNSYRVCLKLTDCSAWWRKRRKNHGRKTSELTVTLLFWLSFIRCYLEWFRKLTICIHCSSYTSRWISQWLTFISFDRSLDSAIWGVRWQRSRDDWSVTSAALCLVTSTHETVELFSAELLGNTWP